MFSSVSLFIFFLFILSLSLVDRLLVPANRSHLSPEKQLQQLLEKFDLTSAMKSSPSRSKRIKLLKKTINELRNEMSLIRVLPSHRHGSSSASGISVNVETSKLKGERLKHNGHFPDDEGVYKQVIQKEQYNSCVSYAFWVIIR